MKLSAQTVELLDKVTKLSEELNATMIDLDYSVAKDTKSEFKVGHSNPIPIQLVRVRNQIDRDTFFILCDIADSGTISESWKSGSKICYNFEVEANKMCILIDDDECTEEE